MAEPNATRLSKCPGRFPEARTCLAEAMDVLKSTEGKTSMDCREDLEMLVDLVGEDELIYSPCKDPYFCNRQDLLRTDPLMADKTNIPIAILPLLAKDAEVLGFSVDPTLLDHYPKPFGAFERTVNGLRLFHRECKDLSKQLDIDLSKICFPGRDNENVQIQGYHLEGTFGIGGTGGIQIVSDCPYMVYLVKTAEDKARNGVVSEETPNRLSLGVGFWYNSDNTLIVGQIQQPRGAVLPAEIHMGVLGLNIAAKIAKRLGCKKIQTYSGKNHPLFIQHPESRSQLEGEFKCLYDKSAQKLGWTGSHGEYYELDVEGVGHVDTKDLKRIYTRDPCQQE